MRKMQNALCKEAKEGGTLSCSISSHLVNIGQTTAAAHGPVITRVIPRSLVSQITSRP